MIKWYYRSLFAIGIAFITIYSFGQEKKTSVAIHSDPRLGVLLKKTKENAKTTNPKNKQASSTGKSIKTPVIGSSGGKYQGKGFRVQIYTGNDRNKATKIREDFIKHYPNIHTYVSYTLPNYKVRVGDFRNKSDAMGMFREASSSYAGCMIVPDKVQIK